MCSRRLRISSIGISAALIAFAFPSQPAQAKGPFAKLVVYGEGTAVEISTPSLLALDSFTDFVEPVRRAQSIPGAGFWIIRYGLDEETGEYRAFDRLRLVASPSLSSPYVYYEGLVDGWSEYDGKWYRGRPQALTELTTHFGVGRSQPPTVPAASDLPIVGLGALFGVGLGLLLGRLSRMTRAGSG